MIEHLYADLRPLGRGRLPAGSLVVDLKISEIVDAGQYIVSAVPRSRSSCVLESRHGQACPA